MALINDSTENSVTISYEEYLVKKGTIADLMIASGSTNIENKINLSFNTNGTITSILVNEGENVSKGNILAELDSKDLLNNLERQKLQIKSAEYAVSQAQKSLRRIKLSF